MYGGQRLQAGNVSLDESEVLGILQHVDAEQLQRLLDDEEHFVMFRPCGSRLLGG